MKVYKDHDKQFCISQTDFSEKTCKHFEGAMTQGSGYLHIRASFEEGLKSAPQDEEYMRLPANVTIETPRHPRSKFGTYIPGVTGNHPLLNNEIVNLPYPFMIKPSVDGEELDIDTCKITNHSRYLDMRDGVLYRSFDWETKSGAVITANYKRFISRKNPNIVLWQGEYIANSPCTLRITDSIYSDVKTNGYRHFDVVKSNAGCLKITTDTDVDIEITSKIFSDKAQFKELGNSYIADIELSANETVTVAKICSFSTSRDSENPLITKSNVTDIDNEYALSASEWDKLWNNSKITIDGDDEAQYAVNFSTYHLLRSINTGDSRVAICAKGFAGEAYFGHFFWDTEVYLLPFFLYTNPDLAKNLVEFRTKTLDGARINAKKLGYDGARYPWESSITGEEQCPNWQYADNEVHITADVVFGLWHYFKNTNDTEFLKSALDVFIETSRYWCRRVYRKKDGSVHINGVMGPDEYICFCNDNTYTNYMVKKSFEITLEAIKLLQYEGISNEELQLFKNISDNIVTEKSNGLYMQCKDFEEFEDIDFDKEWQNRSAMFGKCFSQERNYRSKALKQADVLMLPYLFNSFMSKEELKKHFDYYFPITTHDSSLSNIIHSILLSRLGEPDKAYELFKKSTDIDLDANSGGAAEGIHIANCGGIWQSIIFGFAGLGYSYEDAMPTLNPVLPKHWNSVSFPLYFKNEEYNVMITQTEHKITKKDADSILEKIKSKEIQGIIFDLDGVLVSTDQCHYEAWKMLSDEEGIYFDFSINERLRGVSRMESLEIILERASKEYTEEEKTEMASRKNGYYVEKIKQLTPKATLSGALEFVELAKENNIKVAIGSSSKNTKLILNQIGCTDLFDAIADGNDITKSKPDPEVFLLAAKKLGIEPGNCMVVEDADAGVEAAVSAGAYVLAVGSARNNPKANFRLDSLADF